MTGHSTNTTVSDQQIRSAICAIQLIAPLYCNGIFGTLGRSAAAYGSGMVGAVGHVAGAIRRLLRPRGTARRVSTISARPAERQSAEVDERDAGAHSRRGQLSSVSALHHSRAVGRRPRVAAS